MNLRQLIKEASQGLLLQTVAVAPSNTADVRRGRPARSKWTIDFRHVWWNQIRPTDNPRFQCVNGTRIVAPRHPHLIDMATWGLDLGEYESRRNDVGCFLPSKRRPPPQARICSPTLFLTWHDRSPSLPL